MDNLGYCTPDCLLGGVLNVSECRDAPIIISQPHFYEADYSYQSAIDGIIPNPKYKTFIDIEPNTGIALNVSRQVQINIYLRQLEALKETQKMKNSTLIFPILWLNEHATINESESIKFKSEVLSSIKTAQVICYCLLAVGVILIVIVLITVVVRFVRRRCLPTTRHVQVPSSHRRDNERHRDDDDDDAQLIDAGTA
jgi:hypothetical protein